MSQIDLQRFILAYPEFRNTNKSLVEQKLLEADIAIQDIVWGVWADQGTMLLTAHLLTISPQGEYARLQMNKEKTIYQQRYEELRKVVTLGLQRVI